MGPSAFTFFLGLALAASAIGAPFDRQLERRYPAADGVRLTVALAYGAIRVVPADGAEVRVTLAQSGDFPGEAAAEREWRRLEFECAPESGNRLRVRTRDRRSFRWSWERWPPTTLQLELKVPRSCHLELSTRDGDVTIGDLRGSVRVTAARGTVFVGRIDGPASVITEQGEVTIAGCTGELRASVTQGSLLVGACAGPAELSTSGGSLEVQRAGGPLRAESIDGDLKAGFTGPLGGGATLAARGDVVVSFAAPLAARLEAQTSARGRVAIRDLALRVRSGADGSSRLEAQLGAGGPRVVIRSREGDIRLLGVPAVGDENVSPPDK